MKAAVLENWFDLQLKDIPIPVPGKDEALIKVIRAGVCGSDITVYKGKHMTATVPTVLSHEILGRIESLPEGYDGPFTVGQRVLMNPIISCGKCAACRRGLPHVCENLKLLGIHVDGGFAEYTKVGVDKLVAIDDDFPDEVAILGEPFAVGAHVMVNSDIQPGDKIFISGGATVGLYIAIFAKAAGAERVIISEINEPRRQFVESMGIETINPENTDAMDLMREVTDGGFDIVYDTSGAPSCILQMPDLCRCGGKLLSLGLSGDAYPFIIGKVSFKEIRLIGNRLYSQQDFEAGVRFLEDNWKALHLDRMVTDRLGLTEINRAIEMMLHGENICKIIIDPEK
ncbi:MAG: alcohol dehydrogenase catalytic domain-containing protein [Oscillospiraceae bacterium]|jgi:2-desacetyl-2-hydroxyethyl bacteriochlorophyllide A dehydrogenase|nr:alcohol dehydrogenase catalytic domain-containing protein [Oscillospiraceae bacterium]